MKANCGAICWRARHRTSPSADPGRALGVGGGGGNSVGRRMEEWRRKNNPSWNAEGVRASRCVLSDRISEGGGRRESCETGKIIVGNEKKKFKN